MMSEEQTTFPHCSLSAYIIERQALLKIKQRSKKEPPTAETGPRAVN